MTAENLHKITEIVNEAIPIKKTDCPLKRIEKNGLRHMMTEKIKDLFKYYEQKGKDTEG